MYELVLQTNNSIPYFRSYFVFNYIINQINQDFHKISNKFKVSYDRKDSIVFFIEDINYYNHLQKILNNNIKELIQNDNDFVNFKNVILDEYDKCINKCMSFICRFQIDELMKITGEKTLPEVAKSIKYVLEQHNIDIENLLLYRKGFSYEQLEKIKEVFENENSLSPC